MIPNAVATDGNGEAISILKAAGFGYVIADIPVSNCQERGVVLSQAPSVGTVAPVGSIVTLSVTVC